MKGKEKSFKKRKLKIINASNLQSYFLCVSLHTLTQQIHFLTPLSLHFEHFQKMVDIAGLEVVLQGNSKKYVFITKNKQKSIAL